MRFRSKKQAFAQRMFKLTGKLLAVFVAVSLTTAASPGILNAQQGYWIWTPQQDARQAQVGSCHFRKKFTLDRAEAVEMIAAADDRFIVYMNGKRVGSGSNADKLTKIDLTTYATDGENIIAVHVINSQGDTAAFACQIRVRQQGRSKDQWIASNSTWKTLINPNPLWHTLHFGDKTWDNAVELGPIGSTAPWDNSRMASSKPETITVSTQTPTAESTDLKTAKKRSRFQVPDDFKVRKLLDDEHGSYIAMEFNEFGQLYLSKERGGLLLVDFNERDKTGKPAVKTFTDEVNSCQGILPLNGSVFVIGYGKDGAALYKLDDDDRNGEADKVETICRFKGEPGEHGPHGLVLGADGMLYISVGNASGLDEEIDQSSPARHFYDADLIPRQEDRAGHAAGIKAPGGTIVRVSLDGSKKEIVASGVRNAYDLAINAYGEMFFHDSDMEADTGTPWYRPTQVYQVSAGADYGWRSGWAKFPYYYIDCAEGICDTGRGSPSGGVIYDHVTFPLRYHGALFLADWSEGRILACSLTRQGAGYQAEYQTFLKAQPLTVTDLSIGPDGSLYFCTGGRDTQGAVYRVSWEGGVPESMLDFSSALAKLVRQPQPQSPWARQQLAKLKIEMGDEWKPTLHGIIDEPRNNANYRCRAIDLLNIYGPVPKLAMLKKLTFDEAELVRAKATFLLGMQPRDQVQDTLIEMLRDESALVRTTAANSIQRIGATPDWQALQPLLISIDPLEQLAARKVLETIPLESWREDILMTENQKLFCQGALAMMIAKPSLENSYSVLARASEFLNGFVSDSRFLDMLRIMELALVRGNVDPAHVNRLTARMANEFPAGSGVLNRELSRIIAYLNAVEATDRLVEYIDNHPNSAMDKLQVVLNFQGFASEFSSEQRLASIKFLEQAVAQTEDIGQRQYAETALESFCKYIRDDEIDQILANGAQWPTAALNTFYRLPDSDLTDEQVTWLIEMDRGLNDREDHIAENAKLGIVALLGERGNDEAHAYLREIWRGLPLRRNDIAMGLAQKPEGENWNCLVEGLTDIGDDTAQEVIKQLRTVNRRPVEPNRYRELIILAYRLRDEGGMTAISLLEHWTGEQIHLPNATWRQATKAWAEWFEMQYPESEPVNFESIDSDGKHSISEYLDFIEQNRYAANLEKGKHLFSQANCADCHRFDKQGETLGPDLTSLAKRFSKRETLESILFPSKTISDQYRAHKILTIDGEQFTGMMSKAADGAYIVVQSDGEKVRIPEDSVDDIAVGEMSAMPNGLFDKMSVKDVNDLMAYLYKDEPLRYAEETSSQTDTKR